MKERRDQLLIILYILHLLSTGRATITNVVHKANLNYRSAKRYLSLLEAKGFLQRVVSSEGRHFLITQRGIQAMKDLNKAIDEVLAPVGYNPVQQARV